MSVYTTQFLIYGVSLGYKYAEEWAAKNAPDDDLGIEFDKAFGKFDWYNGPHDGLLMVVDGMNGNHLIVGKLLADGKRHGIVGDGEPLMLPRVSWHDYKEVTAKLEEHFGLEYPKPTYIIYNHYH